MDPTHGVRASKLLPGEYRVASEDMMLVTVLGSCVAACIRDTRLGIGGMNHFMLPDGASAGPLSESARYGSYAMEMLLGELTKLGGRRSSFEAKVFGGGAVMAGLTHANVGERNAAFVLEYLKDEGIPICAKDLLDIYPRKVCYFPRTGRALVKRLRHVPNDTIFQRERDYRASLGNKAMGGDVELFT